MDRSGDEGATQEIWLPPQGQTQISCVIWGKGFNHQDSPLIQAGQPSILFLFFTLCVKPQVCNLPTGQPGSSRLQEWGHSPKALQAKVPSALHSEVLFGPWSSKVMHGNNTKWFHYSLFLGKNINIDKEGKLQLYHIAKQEKHGAFWR